MCLLGEAAPTALPIHELHLGEVEEWLNAAAEIHDGEDTGADLAVELHKCVVRREGHQSHWWEVVDHDYGQDGEHHLESLLLYWVPRTISCHGTAKDPDDGNVAENHDCEGE